MRRVHADRLEDSYEKAGKDHYLFAVDQSEYLVDATNQGGMARFVNHSCGCAPNHVCRIDSEAIHGALKLATEISCACSPNCEVRTVSAEGVRRVVLVSLRAIRCLPSLAADQSDFALLVLIACFVNRRSRACLATVGTMKYTLRGALRVGSACISMRFFYGVCTAKYCTVLEAGAVCTGVVPCMTRGLFLQGRRGAVI